MGFVRRVLLNIVITYINTISTGFRASYLVSQALHSLMMSSKFELGYPEYKPDNSPLEASPLSLI
jgi:hypothetical protein